MTTIRRFSREALASEPHDVAFQDLYPWDQIDETPFGSSLAIVAPGGRTMLHNHAPAETFIICRGEGQMRIDGALTPVGPGDVVYLPPGSVHDLTNTAGEDLVFVSIFWEAKRAAAGAIDPTPRLVIPSPPTANGPLHLGHLAGPYLIADIMTRYYRLRGAPAQYLCLTDDHQSYVVDRAAFDRVTPGETVARFTAAIVDSMRRLGIEPDVVVHPSQDATYRAAVQAKFAQLYAAGKLETLDGETLWCEACQLDLYDSFVVGGCPACGAESYGFTCEACCAPNDSVDLRDPHCDRCRAPASKRRRQRLVFPLAPYTTALRDYHRRVRLSPKLRRLAAGWLAQPDRHVAASQPGTWGIPAGIAGFEGQVLSSWFEIAIAATVLRDRLLPGADLVQFFGYDNAFLYLVHDPAVSLALDAALPLPRGLAANEFLLLDNAKMSTSRQRALDPNDVLAKVPADLLRLYLAKIRPEDAPMNANLAQAQLYLTMIAASWQGWLARLAHDLAAETGAAAPEPANLALVPWSPEQVDFLETLKELVRRAQAGYDGLSLKEVAGAIHEVIDRAAAFGATQRQLAGIASLAAERATALALELVALRVLAVIVAPVMPAFGAALWRCLGETGPARWDEGLIRPVPTGQRIDVATLGARAFFPAAIQLVT